MEELVMPLMDAHARREFSSNGQWDLAYETEDLVRYRVNLYRQKGSAGAVFRILPEKILKAEDLGLPEAVFNLYTKRRGMVLVTGVTGSGKSTTLAALVDLINRQLKKHIITLEDPIEYIHWSDVSNISQREVGQDTDSFASALRAALREDPDVILVGEMRDTETMEIGLESAETGHMVFSTLHTMGALHTIGRIVGMFEASRQQQIRDRVSNVLGAVVSQQLLPKAGEKGYAVAFEILLNNKKITKFITDNNLDGLEEYMRTSEAVNEGMILMDDSIRLLYRLGKISRETAISYAVDRLSMEQLI
jgi:twitching motility protein PilT